LDTALEPGDDAGASDFVDNAKNNSTPVCECYSFMLQGGGVMPMKVRRGGCFGSGCNVDDEHFKPLEVRRDPKYPRHLLPCFGRHLLPCLNAACAMLATSTSTLSTSGEAAWLHRRRCQHRPSPREYLQALHVEGSKPAAAP
jgi:hypothetical protein